MASFADQVRGLSEEAPKEGLSFSEQVRALQGEEPRKEEPVVEEPMAQPGFFDRLATRITEHLGTPGADWTQGPTKLSVIPGVTNEEALGVKPPELRTAPTRESEIAPALEAAPVGKQYVETSEHSFGSDPISRHPLLVTPKSVEKPNPKIPSLREERKPGLEPFVNYNRNNPDDPYLNPYWFFQNTAEPQNALDYVARVIPSSAVKTALAIPKFFFKDLPEPFVRAGITYAAAKQAGVEGAEKQLMLDTFDALYDQAAGFAEFMTRGINVTSPEARAIALEGWMTDPVGTALGLAALYGGVAKTASVAGRFFEARNKAVEAKLSGGLTVEERNAAAEKALEEARKTREELVQEMDPGVQQARLNFLQTTKDLMQEKGLEKKEPAEVASAASKKGFAEAVKKFGLVEEPKTEVKAPEPVVEPAPKSSTVKNSRLNSKKAEKAKPSEAKAPEPEKPAPIIEEPPPAPPAAELPPFRDWLKEQGVKAPKFISDEDLAFQYPDLAEKYEAMQASAPEVQDPMVGAQTPEAPKAHENLLETAYAVDAELAKKRAQDYQRRKNYVEQDLELSTGKLINDVNLWRAGEEIPIEEVRGALSELATRADELQALFPDPRQFRAWKETVKGAAEWARRSERPEPPLKPIPSGADRASIQMMLNKAKDLTGPDAAQAAIDIFRRFYGNSVEGLDLNSIAINKVPGQQSKVVLTGLGKPLEVRLGVDTDLPKALSALGHELLGHGLDPQGIFEGARASEFARFEEIHTKGLSGSWTPEEATFWNNVLDTKYRMLEREQFADVGMRRLREDFANSGLEMPGIKDLNVWRYYRLFSGFDPLEAIAAVEDLLKSGVQGVTNAAMRLVAEGKWKDPEALMAAYSANKDTMKQLLAEKKYNEASHFAALNQALREGAELLRDEGSMKGVKLTNGPDIAEGVNKLYKDLRALKQKAEEGYRLKKFYRQAKRLLLDTQGNIKQDLIDLYGDEGYRMGQRIALRRGAGARASAVYDQAHQEVYKGLNHQMQQVLDEVIFSRRVIQIDSYRQDVKHPGGFGGVEHLEFLKNLERLKELAPEQVADLHKRADAYFDVMKDQLKQLRDEGLITEKTYENLKNFDYSRRQLVEEIDPIFKYQKGSKRVSVRDSGVQSLSRGKTTDALETDSQLLLTEVVVRTQNRIMNNRLNRSMADFVKKHPENPFARLPKKEGGTGKKSHDVAVNYFVDGKKKTLYLHPQVAEEWLAYNHPVNYEVANRWRYASGSALLRPMATGINPAFALRNLPRDLAHVWLTSTHLVDGKWVSTYSPFLPKAAGQMALDVAAVAKDAFTRGQRWKDYINEGGGMEFLVHQGRPLFRTQLGLRNKFQRLYDALGYLNETSEVLGRLALRERALKKGLPAEEATFLARDYMDFSQAGTFTRFVDQSVPYLNARVQATRGIYRAALRNHVETGFKVFQTMALAAGLYSLYRSTDKQALDEMSPRDRANYWIVKPSGMSFTDEKGQKRHVYFRLPKDDTQKFFSVVGEAMMQKYYGDPVDVDQLVEQLGSLSPSPGVTKLMPPSIQALVGYVTNKDFWRNDEIWKGPEIPAGEEWTNRTPEAFKMLGAVGLSPERSKYALERIFTSGTVYNNLVLSGFDEMLKDVPESQRELFWAEALKRGGFKGGFGLVDSFVGITHPLNKSGKNIDEIVEQDNLRRWVNTRTLDAKLDQWLVDKTATRKDVMRVIHEVKDPSEKERLFERMEFANRTKSLTQRSFWMRLHGLTPEARAQAFYDYWKRATPDERKQLQRERGKVDELFTDRFFQEYDRLRLIGE